MPRAHPLAQLLECELCTSIDTLATSCTKVDGATAWLVLFWRCDVGLVTDLALLVTFQRYWIQGGEQDLYCHRLRCRTVPRRQQYVGVPLRSRRAATSSVALRLTSLLRLISVLSACKPCSDFGSHVTECTLADSATAW